MFYAFLDIRLDFSTGLEQYENMVQRSRRAGLSDPSRELQAMREARRALCRVLAAYTISGTVHVAALCAVQALDSVAEEITGDPQAIMPPEMWMPR